VSDLNPYRAPTAPIDHVPTHDGVAPCPKCNTASASKVGFTWWGGALGPRLFKVVKCQQCGTQYNGRTGGKLTKVIIGYQGVVVVLLLVVWFFIRQ
jgi:hypothetical protein